MDAMEALRGRRSIRRYTAEPVPEALTVEILEAAMSAPSAGNQQPWHFVGPGPWGLSVRGPADRRFRPCRDERVSPGDGAGLPSCRA